MKRKLLILLIMNLFLSGCFSYTDKNNSVTTNNNIKTIENLNDKTYTNLEDAELYCGFLINIDKTILNKYFVDEIKVDEYTTNYNNNINKNKILIITLVNKKTNSTIEIRKTNGLNGTYDNRYVKVSTIITYVNNKIVTEVLHGLDKNFEETKVIYAKWNNNQNFSYSLYIPDGLLQKDINELINGIF